MTFDYTQRNIIGESLTRPDMEFKKKGPSLIGRDLQTFAGGNVGYFSTDFDNFIVGESPWVPGRPTGTFL